MGDERNGRCEGWSPWGIGAFIDEEGGFTSVAVALSLLVALVLVVSLVQVQWIAGRSGDVQAVADATAIAGCQVVRMYTEIAEVLDACVVTMGMAAVLMLGAGLVLCFIPFTAPAGGTLTETGGKLLAVRKDFATGAAEGLRTAEKALPALICADSFVTAEANGGDVKYVGIALPFPDESKSDFNLADDVDASKLTEANEATRKASEKAQEAKEKLQQAQYDGWYADCGSEGACLRERAATLAGLGGNENPSVASADDWNFGIALKRARAYYSARLAREAPANDSADETSNSAMRRAYYQYARDELAKGYYRESGGSVSMELPELAHDTETTRGTALYDRVTWPCTQEGERQVIHAWAGCPGATGPSCGTATLKDLEEGRVARCETCKLTIGQMGRVASATYHAESGFEHHWDTVVQASKRWKDAKEELDRTEKERKDAADGGVDAFKEALGVFKTPRVKLCPPGAWGCISIVAHGDVTPEELANGFTGEASLPSGVAIAGATLAPDDDAKGNDLLSHLADSFEQGEAGGLIEGVLSFVLSMWAGLLNFYNGAAKGIGGIFNGIFDTLDKFGFGWIGDPIKNALTGAIELLGLEPADLRQKKPVLCNTNDIMKKDGNDLTQKILDYVYVIDPDMSMWDAVLAVGGKAAGDLLKKDIEIPFKIPFLNIDFPFKINLSKILGLA